MKSNGYQPINKSKPVSMHATKMSMTNNHLLSLLSPKVGTHATNPKKIEGWVWCSEETKISDYPSQIQISPSLSLWPIEGIRECTAQTCKTRICIIVIFLQLLLLKFVILLNQKLENTRATFHVTTDTSVLNENHLSSLSRLLQNALLLALMQSVKCQKRNQKY